MAGSGLRMRALLMIAALMPITRAIAESGRTPKDVLDGVRVAEAVEMRARFERGDDVPTGRGAEYAVERSGRGFKMHTWSTHPGLQPLLDWVIADDGENAYTYEPKSFMVQRGASQLDAGQPLAQEACVSPVGWLRAARARVDRGERASVSGADGRVELAIAGEKDTLTLVINERTGAVERADRLHRSGSRATYDYLDYRPVDGTDGRLAAWRIEETKVLAGGADNRVDHRTFVVTSVRPIALDATVGTMPSIDGVVTKDVRTGQYFNSAGVEFKRGSPEASGVGGYVYVAGGVALCLAACVVWRVRRRALEVPA